MYVHMQWRRKRTRSRGAIECYNFIIVVTYNITMEKLHHTYEKCLALALQLRTHFTDTYS